MFTSYLKTIESIVGPYTEEEVYSIYADPNTGKTVLLLGEVFNAISQGQRVVWIDTEGGHEGMFKQFGPSYAKRFGVDINKLEDKYEYIQLLTAQELINYFGVDAEILYDKKISVLMKGFKTKPDGTIYENWGKKKGNLVIIIDSFSSPFRLGFSTKVENFSARADAQGVLVYGLLRFMRQTSANIK